MQQRLIRISEVQKMVGIGKTLIYEKIREETFPRQIKVGSASGWVESEIQEWIHRQIQQSRHPIPRR